MTQTEILDQLRKQLVTGVFIKKGVELNMDTRFGEDLGCLLYTSPSPRDRQKSRMPSSA